MTMEKNDQIMDNDDTITSCRPPKGKTYLTIGQDLFSIHEYVLSQYNASLHQGSIVPMSNFHPAGTMFYTDIQTLQGLVDYKPVDYGSGIEYANGLAQSFPTSGIQIGLWLNGSTGCADIVNGILQDNIEQLMMYLQQLNVPKIFLRIGYEFDNPSFGYSDHPDLYQQAFQIIVDTCQKMFIANSKEDNNCRQKIAFVWHSWAAPRVTKTLDPFYPGDDYVDWIGLSVFQQVYPWANMNMNDDGNNNFAGGTMQQVQDVLDFATVHDKPIMISESTPFGGIDLQDVVGEGALEYLNKHGYYDNNSNNMTSINQKDAWDLWFQPTLDLIEEYDIGMWSYINCNWNVQPMWHGIGFGNTLLSSSENVMNKWKEHVLNNPRFLTRLECDTTTSSSTTSSTISAATGSSWSSSLSFSSLSSSSFIMSFTVFVFAVLLLAGSCHFGCQQYQKHQKRRSSRQSGYAEVSEEEEEKALGELKQHFGSSSRLDENSEELLLQRASFRSSYRD